MRIFYERGVLDMAELRGIRGARRGGPSKGKSKGKVPLETYSKRMSVCVCVCVCV